MIARVSEFMRWCACAYEGIRVHARVYAQMCVYIRWYTCTCADVRVHSRVFVGMCGCACACAGAYESMHARACELMRFCTSA